MENNSTIYSNSSMESAKTCSERAFSTGAFVFALNLGSCVINTILTIVTIVVNTLILYAVSHTPSLRTASMILLCGLAIINFGTGAISQPLHVAINVLDMLQDTKRCDLNFPFEMSIYVFSVTSLFILVVISFDRVLAICLRARYKIVVTVNRAVKLLVLISLFSGSLIPLRFVAPGLLRALVICLITLSLVSITTAYSFIFWMIRRQRGHMQAKIGASVQNEENPTRRFDIKKYTKSSRTAALVAALIVLCYLPDVCVQMGLLTSKEYTDIHRNMHTVTVTLFLANSAANPMVCIWRMQSLRAAVFGIVKKLLCIQ